MNPQDKIERLRLALVALKEAAERLDKEHYGSDHGASCAAWNGLQARADDAQTALEECGYG